MKLTPNIVKAVEEGFALVLYQDENGVHVGVIDQEAIVEARTRKVLPNEAEPPREAGEDYYSAGFMDTDGGNVNTKVDFGPVWDQIASMFVGDA